MKIRNQSNMILKRQENIDEISRFLMVEYPVLLQQFNMREKYYEDDFHIIEYYMDKLVCETAIADKEELIEILGLETNREIAEVFYKNLITCNHIVEGKQWLHATEWARNSVESGKKQIEKTSKRKMYFDAINCKPLPVEFYKNSYRIRRFSEILNYGAYFINTWNDPNQFELQNAVLALKGEERIRYNIPQELIDIDFDYDEYEKATEHVQFTPFYIALYKDGSFKTFDAVTYQEESFFRSILERNPSILEEIMISTGLKEVSTARGQNGVKIKILNRVIQISDDNLSTDINGDFVYEISEALIKELIQDKNYYILRQIYQFDRICSGDDFLGSIVHLKISDSLINLVEEILIKGEAERIGHDDGELLEQRIQLLKVKRRKR
ncbi:MAG TPA: hypothetical protein GXZ22_02955 [Clostridiaceae bacterium]|nr:hypothetical protein [Clostridiaceae bacterium]